MPIRLRCGEPKEPKRFLQNYPFSVFFWTLNSFSFLKEKKKARSQGLFHFHSFLNSCLIFIFERKERYKQISWLLLELLLLKPITNLDTEFNKTYSHKLLWQKTKKLLSLNRKTKKNVCGNKWKGMSTHVCVWEKWTRRRMLTRFLWHFMVFEVNLTTCTVTSRFIRTQLIRNWGFQNHISISTVCIYYRVVDCKNLHFILLFRGPLGPSNQ